jgi:hypothetical protein
MLRSILGLHCASNCSRALTYANWQVGFFSSLYYKRRLYQRSVLLDTIKEDGGGKFFLPPASQIDWDQVMQQVDAVPRRLYTGIEQFDGLSDREILDTYMQGAGWITREVLEVKLHESVLGNLYGPRSWHAGAGTLYEQVDVPGTPDTGHGFGDPADILVPATLQGHQERVTRAQVLEYVSTIALWGMAVHQDRAKYLLNDAVARQRLTSKVRIWGRAAESM